MTLHVLIKGHIVEHLQAMKLIRFSVLQSLEIVSYCAFICRYIYKTHS